MCVFVCACVCVCVCVSVYVWRVARRWVCVCQGSVGGMWCEARVRAVVGDSQDVVLGGRTVHTHMHARTQVPVGDNYFAALNSAVFSDGSFVYIPKGVRCPMELSTYFRINASETGQVRCWVCVCVCGLGWGGGGCPLVHACAWRACTKPVPTPARRARCAALVEGGGGGGWPPGAHAGLPMLRECCG